MTQSSFGTLILCAIGGLLAWGLGGSLGAGVMAGTLLGSATAVLEGAVQRHLARTRPALVMAAFAGGFLVKLAVLTSGTALLRFVPEAGARFDWRGFLLSYAVAAVVLLILCAPESARALREQNAS